MIIWASQATVYFIFNFIEILISIKSFTHYCPLSVLFQYAEGQYLTWRRHSNIFPLAQIIFHIILYTKPILNQTNPISCGFGLIPNLNSQCFLWVQKSVLTCIEIYFFFLNPVHNKTWHHPSTWEILPWLYWAPKDWVGKKRGENNNM